MLKSPSTSLIVRGILALAVGAIALAWPGVTVLALVILFAVYAFIAAGLQAARAFSSPKARAGYRAPAAWAGRPGRRGDRAGLAGAAALVLVLVVGVWAVIAGFVEIAAAFQAGEQAGTRALFILGELVRVAFGVVLCARPGMSAVALALLFSLFNLIYRAWTLVQGIELRRTGKTLHHPVREKTAA